MERNEMSQPLAGSESPEDFCGLCPQRPKKCEITFDRDYTRQDNWDRADALLQKAMSHPDNQSVIIVGNLEILNTFEPIKIAPGVIFKLLSVKMNDRGGCDLIKFVVSSETRTIGELFKFVSTVTTAYLAEKRYNLGDQQYYFDQIIERTMPRMPPPKKILFTKHPFSTNRTLDNMFHERQQEITDRVEFFLNNKAWYDVRGIPYTLGLLLHGQPGTGKTTTIKAIAGVSKRHIVNINIGCVKTKKHLKKLFYDDRLEVSDNPENLQQTTEYVVPIDRRIYVIEDIDALTSENNNILLKRTGLDTGKQEVPDEYTDLDLATVLNVIDGTLETPGRILIITSNYPQKLDEAFIRPGRMDLFVEYKVCTLAIIQQMYQAFFNGKEPHIPELNLAPEIDMHWTPAEVSQILFKNMKTPHLVGEDLAKLKVAEESTRL